MTDAPNWLYPASRILVFAKVPRAGQVKTRLAKAIGAEEAARVYGEWLQDAVVRLHRARLAPIELWVTPDTRHPLFRQLVDTIGIELHTQPDGDLGQRMHRVMLHALARCESAVLIGSDCPVMQPDYVQRALAVMEAGVDTVLGPAEDGGYVLLGLRKVVAELFAGIPWSTGYVLKATRGQLRAVRRNSWAELETLWDIDRVEDYERWRALQRALSAAQRKQQNETGKEVKIS